MKLWEKYEIPFVRKRNLFLLQLEHNKYQNLNELFQKRESKWRYNADENT